MDVSGALAVSGGLAARQMLLDLHVGRGDLGRALAEGSVVRHGRWYTAGGAPREMVRAAELGGAAACASALFLRGVPLLRRPEPVHVATASARTACGAVLHRRTGASGVEDLLPAAARAVRCLPRAEALAMADAVLRTGVDLDDLILAAGPRPGREARWVLDHADSRSDSVLESALRAAALQAAPEELRLQVPLEGIGRVDLLADGWLVLEADGYTDHGTPAAFHGDRVRSATASRCGLETLRFSWRAVVGDPAGVTETIREVLDRRRRPGRRSAGARRLGCARTGLVLTAA